MASFVGAVIAVLIAMAGSSGIRPNELISVCISAAALLVGLSTLYYNRVKGRQELFLKIHEQLIAADIQERRRLLVHEVDETGTVNATEEEWTKINRSLALFDVM